MNKQKAYELRLNICLQIESLKDGDPDRISWRKTTGPLELVGSCGLLTHNHS